MAKDYWVDSNEIDLAHHAFLIIWSIVLLRVVDLNYIVIRLFYCDDSIICNSLFALCVFSHVRYFQVCSVFTTNGIELLFSRLLS